MEPELFKSQPLMSEIISLMLLTMVVQTTPNLQKRLDLVSLSKMLL